MSYPLGLAWPRSPQVDKSFMERPTAVIQPQLGNYGYTMAHSVDVQTFVNLRKRAGLTQRQVADALGVTVTTVSNWETGAKEPRLDFSQTEKLMEIYQCSISELSAALQALRQKRETA